LTLTSELLARWLTENNDQMDKGEVRALRAPTTNGASNDIYLFDVLWTKGTATQWEKLVLRVTPKVNRIFPQYALERDFQLLRFLSDRTGVPVPKPRWLEPRPDLLGGSFYIMDRAPGAVPPDRPSYHAEGWFVEATAERRRQIWMAGIEAMARVHDVRPEHLGCNFFHPGSRRPGLDSQLPYYRRFYDWACNGDLSSRVADAFTWLEQNTPQQENVRLTWGDARLGNSIHDDEGRVTLLDWEMADFGDPGMDVMFWLFADYCASDALGIPRLPGVPDAEETIDHYQSHTGRKLKDASFYEVFALVRSSCIISRMICMLGDEHTSPAHQTLHDNLVINRLAEVMGRLDI